ncbi:MAG TPA: site-specific integrase [Pirellulales bacterium]|nr:site-specific integrase [Pirellulales bacterium]
MSTKKPQLKKPLAAFIDESIRSGTLPITRRSRRAFINAINRFTESLGRSALVSDLSYAGWATFGDYIYGKYTAHTCENLRYYFRRLWRLAFELGHVSTAPPPKTYASAKWADAQIGKPEKGEKPKTLRQVFVWYYKPLRLRGRGEKNDLQYRVNIDHLQKFLGREPILTDLDDELITAFINSFVESGRAPATAQKARSHILALWRFAARKQFVDKFPDVPAVPQPQRIPKAWSKAELATLFAALRDEPGEIGGVPAGAWWLALHQILWWTAERINAVMQLRWSDVDLDSGWLIVPAEFRKFQTADKSTELPAEAIEALRAIREPARELLFPWPYTPVYLWAKYGRILKRAGLPTDRKSKFHRMRKSAASYFEAAGGNATELLGHSARRVTLNYLSPAIVKPQQTAGMLFSPTAPRKDGAA